MSASALQKMTEVLLPLLFSFGTVFDNAKFSSVSKYFYQQIHAYYTQLSVYNHTIQSQQPITFALTDNIVAWLANKLQQINEFIINNEITTSQLKIILKNKSNVKYIDISPYYPHYKITFDIYDFLMEEDFCPNLECIKSIGCNIQIKIQPEYVKAISKLQTFEQQHKNTIIQRLPEWFAGDAIIYRYDESNSYEFKDNDMPTGEIHTYKLNGMYNYSRDIQNNGIVIAVNYCPSDPSHNTIKFDLWLTGWYSTIWGVPTFISRPWDIPKDVIEKIENDESVRNALKQLNIEGLLNKKYRWRGDQTVQKDTDLHPLLDWPQHLNRNDMYVNYSVQLIEDS